MGKKAVLACGNPSLGPVFGIKGGAAGGGYAQVVPIGVISTHILAGTCTLLLWRITCLRID